MSTTIIIGQTLQERMLIDFELERQECLKLIASSTKGSDMWLRGIVRLAVVNQSVDELKKSIQNPFDYLNRIEGGYTEEETKRLADFKEMIGNAPIPKPMNGHM